MMKWEHKFVGVLMLTLVACSGGQQKGKVALKRYLEDGNSGIPAAVRISDGVLIHTTQLFAKRNHGEKNESSVSDELGEILDDLDSMLKVRGSDVEKVAKLNLYVSDPAECDAVRDALVKWYGKRSMPAITVISTPLPRPGAKVALDAVALVGDTEKPKGVEVWSDIAAEEGRTFGGEALAAVAGKKTDLVYISGRASKADDLRKGTEETMKQLMFSLQMLGAGAENVVQIKAFLNPMTEAAFAAEAIQSFFEKGDRPPVVMVEWTSSSYPTEIEMIAAIPERESGEDVVTYMTLPGDKPSPVYSKMAVVKGGKMIYVGEMVGDAKVSAETETGTLFDRLKQAVEAAGSDYKHLVKATYYVSDTEVSKELNNLRPKIYDPKKPPTASKVTLENIGVPDRGMLIDMIAVPKE
ncbi:MAG: hypothetical protein GXP30_13430 [Verrucomicrobia bacterium]|nr:hypothetical protein [Verrucomicrobiota bacterium]